VIFQTEKQLKEFGDKIPADKKAPIEAALEKLKEAHKNQDVDSIEPLIKEVQEKFQAASQDLYNAANAGAGGAGNPFTGADNPFGNANPFGGGGQPNQPNDKKDDGGVTDVDFEEVK